MASDPRGSRGSAAVSRAADPRCRGGWRPLARDRPRHRAAARARVTHRSARGAPRRARRSNRSGARGHLLRRAPPRLRVHVERARGDAAVRRRHRAQSRLLPHRPDQPRGAPCLLQGPRRGRPAPEVRARLIEDAIANAGPRARDAFAMMCEVAQRFAGWLGLGPDIQAALEYVFARWDGRGFPGPPARRSRCRCVSCTWRETSPFPHRSGSRRGARCRRASIGRRVRPCARRARRAELRRHPRRVGRGADVGARDRERAISTDLYRGRPDRQRIRGDRRDHRSQVPVAARAPDRRGRARRGRRLAHGPSS